MSEFQCMLVIHKQQTHIVPNEIFFKFCDLNCGVYPLNSSQDDIQILGVHCEIICSNQTKQVENIALIEFINLCRVFF